MKKIVIKIILSLVVFVFVFAAAVQIKFAADQKKNYESTPFEIKALVAGADLELGKRLYSVRNGCIDCHGENLAGAMVMEDPAMGSIHGANITPYTLLDWSDEEIARAIRYGIHKTGRSLQFMPSFDFAGLSLGDVAALVAYVRSVAPVEKPSHPNSFGPVAKALSFFGQMPVMFPAAVVDLKRGFGEKPAEEPTAEFGKYLAHSCTGCHGEEFRGGKIPGGDPSWPKAANIRLGANSVWTEDVFKETILTGVSPVTKAKLNAPMPLNLLKQMNEVEIKALWAYLGTLK